MPIRVALMFVFFVGSLPFCFIRPFYGILLWAVISYLNPQSTIIYSGAPDSGAVDLVHRHLHRQ